MKFEPPLSNLVARCQTLCVAECCGRDAYDFSPIQIASYLTMWRGGIDEAELRVLRTQLEALKANYGLKSSSFDVTIEEMNQIFDPNGIERMVQEIEWNLSVATRLVSVSEKEEYKNEK
jgi:hypothetical protein